MRWAKLRLVADQRVVQIAPIETRARAHDRVPQAAALDHRAGGKVQLGDLSPDLKCLFVRQPVTSLPETVIERHADVVETGIHIRYGGERERHAHDVAAPVGMIEHACISGKAHRAGHQAGDELAEVDLAGVGGGVGEELAGAAFALTDQHGTKVRLSSSAVLPAHRSESSS